jgi:hypothetical protein
MLGIVCIVAHSRQHYLCERPRIERRCIDLKAEDPFAANSGKYDFFLASLFIVASGLACLDTASNPFIAQLGPTATSEPDYASHRPSTPSAPSPARSPERCSSFSGVELTKAQAASMRAAGSYNALSRRAPPS